MGGPRIIIYLTRRFAHASNNMIDLITNVMKERQVPYIIGASWTIDAPYRETRSEILKYKEEGIHCVEMEAAALYAVASFLGCDAASIFTISDYLSEKESLLHFHLTEEYLKKIFLIAFLVLNKLNKNKVKL
jgi:purine-nucleoside phosphorylase